MPSAPSLIIGTGGFGVSWSEDHLEALAEAIKDAGINRIDTAALYPVHAPGLAEKLLGQGGYAEKGFIIDSKVLYGGDGKGTLTGAAIEKSLSQTLESLKTPKLDVLYCHGPDTATPLADQAAGMDAQYRAGKFSHLGVCNFSPEMLGEWLSIASEKGYIKPSVFQGQYNLLCRSYESAILPLLRKHDIAFVAFSPLAGGFLTGKLTRSSGPEELKGTRFEVSDTNFMGMGFRHWYDKPSMHAAIRQMEELCKSHGVSMSDAAFRWALYHSALHGEKGDRVIIGPSSLSQLTKYSKAAKSGSLDDELVKGLNGLWEGVEEDARSIIA